MQEYKTAFIDFMVRAGVLSFGDFLTKSGRPTPYFVNTGRYRTGTQLALLGRFYASAIVEHVGTDFDLVFGPAYKGIPIATATAIALSDHHRLEVGLCFNRKEAKDHGEGGHLIGQIPEDGDRVLIVEDVTTAGTSVHESVRLLEEVARVKLAGLVVSVDRMERGTGEQSALSELATRYSMPTFAVVTIDEVMSALRGRAIDGRVLLTEELHEKMVAYRREYGAGD